MRKHAVVQRCSPSSKQLDFSIHLFCNSRKLLENCPDRPCGSQLSHGKGAQLFFTCGKLLKIVHARDYDQLSGALVVRQPRDHAREFIQMAFAYFATVSLFGLIDGASKSNSESNGDKYADQPKFSKNANQQARTLLVRVRPWLGDCLDSSLGEISPSLGGPGAKSQRAASAMTAGVGR